MALYDAAVTIPLLTVDGDGYLSSLATGTFYDSLSAAPGAAIIVVADLPVEWDGSFDLVLTWDVIQFLLDELLLHWNVVPAASIANDTLVLTWNVTESLVVLILTWTVVPAGLLTAYELDPQRPYGRVTKP